MLSFQYIYKIRTFIFKLAKFSLFFMNKAIISNDILFLCYWLYRYKKLDFISYSAIVYMV